MKYFNASVALGVVVFSLSGCGDAPPVNSARNADELAVLAQSPFFKGTVTPTAGAAVQAVAPAGQAAAPSVPAQSDLGFVAGPNTPVGSDFGVVSAPSTGSPTVAAPVPTPTPAPAAGPTSGIVAATPSAGAGTTVPSITIPAAPPTTTVGVTAGVGGTPTTATSGTAADGGVIAAPGSGGGSDGGALAPPSGGGVAQSPAPVPSQGGTPPGLCTDPSVCPGFNVVLNRVCSRRRSAIPFPEFVFFEEAKQPILTFESQNDSCSDSGSRSLAAVGTPMPSASQSRLLNILFSPKASAPQATTAVAKQDLKGVDLLSGKYRTRMAMAIDVVKSMFPNSWRQVWVAAAVCDDTNGDGLCAGEGKPYQLLAASARFRLGQVPKNINLMVWNGRSRNIWNDPDICEEQISPLVLDLSGDGFSFSSPENGVDFDLKDDGNPVLTGWTQTQDEAFLVRDINRNGLIDTGAELFGSATRMPNGSRADNGFVALAALDSNGNALFEPADVEWINTRLWIDRNRDGVSDPGELVSLDRAGIESISLNYIAAQEFDANGNETKQRAVYRRRVGGVSVPRQVIDIWFDTLNVE